MNDDILLTREQIGTALEYSDPAQAIKRIHRKHKERLEPLCVRTKISGGYNSGTPLNKSEEQERVYYTDRGVMEICRWSTKKKANQFMDYFNVSRTKLYNNLYIELQNRYPDIDLNQIQEDYCYENGIESCYTMDVIEHTKDVRARFENMVEELLNRYDLKEKEAESLNKETIFV